LCGKEILKGLCWGFSSRTKKSFPKFTLQQELNRGSQE
jgi:hypothetical protein